MKMKFKSNRKAFTLVELLIVIAIIGILFVVLVSKVDFATDKANATGVQTDFRSFQVAFETVSRENAGFNTLGWDTGDKADDALIAGYTYLNADKDCGDRVRNSYDKGDMNLNGICEDGETWTGQKLYTETWTGVYTLNNPADATDMSAYLALEKAINKNLDPALQISIDPENKTIYMANGYQDPWKTEYHGVYLSNANGDGMDRGAIVLYSDGPNKIFGSEQTIAKGKVTVTVKNGGINGQDDMALVTCYTYMNGYGEVATITEGFSNNQVLSGNGNSGVDNMLMLGTQEYQMLEKPVVPITNIATSLAFRSEAPYSEFKQVKVDGTVIDASNYTVTEGSTIITFKSEYLATLSNGNHNVEIVSEKGSAKCTIEIALSADVVRLIVAATSPADSAWFGATSITTIDVRKDGREYVSNSTVKVGSYVGAGMCHRGDAYVVAKYNSSTDTYEYRYLMENVYSDNVEDYGETRWISGNYYNNLCSIYATESAIANTVKEFDILCISEGAWTGCFNSITVNMNDDGNTYVSNETVDIGYYVGGGMCQWGKAYVLIRYNMAEQKYDCQYLLVEADHDIELWGEQPWEVGDVVSANCLIINKDVDENLKTRTFDVTYLYFEDGYSGEVVVDMLEDGKEYISRDTYRFSFEWTEYGGEAEEAYVCVAYRNNKYEFRLLIVKSPNEPYDYRVGTYVVPGEVNVTLSCTHPEATYNGALKHVCNLCGQRDYCNTDNNGSCSKCG